MSKAIVKEQNHDIAKAPDMVIEEAQRASQKLVEIVSKKTKPVIINGEQYLEFEDWQTLGRFYGLFVKTGEAEPVVLNGVKGFKARAVVVNKDGLEVGSAEAYCMYDEQNWKNKPAFQLASMAQTRAGAKALRNLLSWVAVLAGYKPTPAEEIIEIKDQLEEKAKAVESASEAQRRAIYSIFKSYCDELGVCKEKELQKEALFKIVEQHQEIGRKIKSTKDLTKDEASILITYLKDNAEEVKVWLKENYPPF